MTLPCPTCQAEISEGASQCPSCGAGIAEIVVGKRKSLSRTLIGKAVELRNSIPWAAPSAVVLLDRVEPRRTRHPLKTAAVGLGVLLAGLGAWAVLHRAPRSTMMAAAIERPALSDLEGQSKAPPASPAPERAPDPELPPVEPASPSAEASSPADEPVLPAPTRRSAPAAPLPEPRPARPAAPAKHPATAKAPPASSAKGGTLTVKAYYKGKPVVAKVYVNGADKGITPLTVRLSPSKYSLRVEKRGYRIETRRDVSVRSGKVQALRVDFRK